MGTDARGAPAHLPRCAHPGRATAGSNSRRRRVYALTPLVLAIVGPVAAAAPPAAPARSSGPPPRASFTTGALRVALHGEAARLFTIGRRGQVRVFEIAPPILEVDGVSRTAVLAGLREAGAPRSLGDGVTERRYRGVLADDPALTLEVVFRTTERHSVLRFAYRLFGADGRRLTRRTGADALTYLSASLVGLPLAREVRLSEFVERLQSYTASERPIDVRHFDNSRSVMGPLLLASDRQTSLLLGYEHGSPVPDAFLEFALSPGRGVTLRAVKGNIVGREALSPDRAFETVWLEAGVLLGDNDAVAAAYRQFVHEALMAGNASRKPLVFYNTWNFQERNHWVNDKSHLDSMSEARMLTEIDVARRMGIDVFVLDKGWYEKTGDWAVSAAQFPNGLGPLKARLDAAGMRLGLWFNPLAAAESSRAWEANKPHVRSTGGKTFTGPVWETEDSHQMCLVSPWGEAFAEALVRVARETGATYFKWDGVGQWGCDAPGHGHGGDADTAAARAEAYAFELPRVMMRLARNVAEQIPGAIVDFDVTEGGRAVGLGFLSAGKYVLINNGPNNETTTTDPSTARGETRTSSSTRVRHGRGSVVDRSGSIGGFPPSHFSPTFCPTIRKTRRW